MTFNTWSHLDFILWWGIPLQRVFSILVASALLCLKPTFFLQFLAAAQAVGFYWVLRIRLPHQLSGEWVGFLFVFQGSLDSWSNSGYCPPSSLVRLLPGYDPGISFRNVFGWVKAWPVIRSLKPLRSDLCSVKGFRQVLWPLTLSLPPQLPNGDK